MKKVYTDVYTELDKEEYDDPAVRRNYENSVWYRIYVQYSDTVQKVWTLQRDFLLCRDMSMACLYLMVVYLIGCFAFRDVKLTAWVFALLGVEFVLCDIAMRSKGTKMALDVIATDISHHGDKDVACASKETRDERLWKEVHDI